MASGTQVSFVDHWGQRWDGVVVCRSFRCRDVYVELTRADGGGQMTGVVAVDELVGW